MPQTDDYPRKPTLPLRAAERSAPFGGGLDTMAVLRASQALTSERTAARLNVRVEALLRNLVGASKVELALWDERANDWVLQSREENSPNAHDAALVAQRVPLSALQHAACTAEPLLLTDALTDTRYSHDPYFEGMERCSLIVVPILHHRAARAMLVLENRNRAGAFTSERLHAVLTIAGQLAVALENAKLYERLETQVTEQTRQLKRAEHQLLAEARRAGMAQIATNVLHNVGNVLTSVNVSAHVLSTQVRQSPAARISDIAELLNEQAGDLEAFFAPGGRGQLLPGYLRELANALGTERQQLLDELENLCGSVNHIKNVVAMQQSYAGGGRLMERVRMSELADDALRLQEVSLARHGVHVQRDYTDVQAMTLDKTRVMQILVNLLDNARQAMGDVEGERHIDVSVREEGESIVVGVRDRGCGIPPENLPLMFTHGFTTKADGHGFGLHSCAMAAQEMGGTLTAHSDGPGTGAEFVLRLPRMPAVAGDGGSTSEAP